MRISLVRHGQKQRDLGNPPLTLFGQAQAKKTGEFFLGKDVSHIFASPLLRTQQTAQHISESVGIPFATNPLLRERGEWLITDGLPWEEFLSQWKQASIDRNYNPGYGDTSSEAGQRVQKAIADVFSDHDVIHAILVSHGGAIMDFLRNIFSDDYLIEKHFEHYQNIIDTSVPECSITTLVHENGNWQLERICFTAHLQDLSRE
jgi:broad specificity phosphatase PhoE